MGNKLSAEPRKNDRIKVRAIKDGTYGHGLLGSIYRHSRGETGDGDVFTLTPREIPVINLETGKPERDPETNEIKTRILSAKEQFSESWMEIVPADEPERLTTAQQEINRQTAELNSNSRAARAEAE